MREIIQKVLNVEAEAKRLIRAAEAQAESIRSEARIKAVDMALQSRQAAEAEAESIVTAALADAEHERKARLARAIAEFQNQLQLSPSVQRQVVDAIVQCICGAVPNARDSLFYARDST